MEWFYIITTVLAVIFLILSLVFVGLMMKKNSKIQIFPVSVSQCPDLWVSDGSFCKFDGKNNGSYVLGNDDATKKFFKIGNTDTFNDETNSVSPFVKKGEKGVVVSASTINPYDDSSWISNGTTAKCGQKKWATLNNIQWTGIREYNNC
jgi:hypothetical protein